MLFDQLSPAKRLALTLGGYVALGLSGLTAKPAAAEHPKAPAPPQTCFSGQTTPLNPAAADRAAKSTVALAIYDAKDNIVATGTGFIVSDSGSFANSHNRIVTAGHVGAPQGGHIGIIPSDGSGLMGEARVIITRDNISVLEMVAFIPKQDQKYDSLPGLILGQMDSKGFLTGAFSYIGPGDSGSALINNSDGTVMGVMQASYGGPANTKIQRPSIFAPFSADGKEIKYDEAKVADKRQAYISTITDHGLLKALNSAGGKVSITALPQPTSVTMYILPDHRCGITNGSVAPLDFDSIAQFAPPGRVLESYWNDPKRAVDELKSLLDDTQIALPEQIPLPNNLLLKQMRAEIVSKEGLDQFSQSELAQWQKNIFALAIALKDTNPQRSKNLSIAADVVGTYEWRKNFYKTLGKTPEQILAGLGR